MKVSIIVRNMVKSLTSLYKMIDGQCLGPAKGHKYFMTTLFRIVVFFSTAAKNSLEETKKK